jgi:hypothetical protein
VFGPGRADLFIAREFAARRSLFRLRNRRALIGWERHTRGLIATGKLKNNAGDVVLSIRWEAARNLKCLF